MSEELKRKAAEALAEELIQVLTNWILEVEHGSPNTRIETRLDLKRSLVRMIVALDTKTHVERD